MFFYSFDSILAYILRVLTLAYVDSKCTLQLTPHSDSISGFMTHYKPTRNLCNWQRVSPKGERSIATCSETWVIFIFMKFSSYYPIREWNASHTGGRLTSQNQTREFSGTIIAILSFCLLSQSDDYSTNYKEHPSGSQRFCLLHLLIILS